MITTNKELQLRKNCQLYKYLLVSLGKEVPGHIEECANAFDADYLVNCASELSEALKELDRETLDKIINDPHSKVAHELAFWWEMQQEADRLGKTLTKTCL